VVAELQEYAVVLKARAYVRSPDYWQALYGLRKDVQRALRQANVLIAVNRQAAVIRNEARSAVTTPPSEERVEDRESPPSQAAPRAPGSRQKTGLNA
jgi:small-conductance mechanosensitive channel